MNYDRLISQAWWQYDHYMQHGLLMEAVRYNKLATQLVVRLIRRVQG